MVFPYRHHQGRLLKRRIPGIDFGPAIEKHLDRVDVAGVRSGHQGGLSRWIGRIRIRTGIEQGLHVGAQLYVSLRGQTVIDEELLRTRGVTDFAPYSMTGKDEGLAPDIFLS